MDLSSNDSASIFLKISVIQFPEERAESGIVQFDNEFQERCDDNSLCLKNRVNWPQEVVGGDEPHLVLRSRS